MLKIGNAQGFWGDSPGAPAQLIAQQPDLHFLTLDYLAEVSMSILAMQREKDPSKGYAADFIEAVRSLIPFWNKRASFKVIANAGGLNPLGCAKAVLEVLKEAGLLHMKVGVVSGDNVLHLLKTDGAFNNLDTGKPLNSIRERLVSANAYFGAKPLAQALDKGADIVITGRVADPSLTVACCASHYQWKWDDYDKLAAATIAGHLIECGVQVTGGISTNWLEIPNKTGLGFPIIEMSSDASFAITKPQHTGGVVNEQTVKEQLLYEIGDPDNYLSPDVTVSFLGLKLKSDGKDRIKISGARGRLPSETYKVSATYRDGFISEGILTLFGRDIYCKAHACGKIILQQVKDQGYDLARFHLECIGGGDIFSQTLQEFDKMSRECVLRIAVADPRKEAVLCFSRQMASLITSGPQGVTGYTLGRPKVRPAFGYWPCLIAVNKVDPRVEILEVAE